MLALLLLLSLSPALAAPSASADDVALEERDTWAPEAWIDAVNAQAESLPGLRYSAVRTTRRPSREGAETTLEERWRFVLFGRDRFRVDYFGDTARQITCNGLELLDYVPANGMAQRHHMTRMSAEDRVALVQRILSKVAVPGFRLGVADGVTWREGEVTELDGRPVVQLLGDGADDSHLEYLIDRERLAVLRTEVHQDGQVVLRTVSTDHREISPGVWFPHAVEIRAPDKGGEVRVSLSLTKVAVVTESPDHLFTTVLDSSIRIDERP